MFDKPIPLFGPTGSWREANKDLFPSDESLRYQIRDPGMRYTFLASGALVKLRGQFQVTDPAALRQAVLAFARRVAQRSWE